MEATRASMGIPGLDDVLGGGLPQDRIYLVQGTPGVGKTTLALQFLLSGVQKKERVLYITLSESEEEVRQVAESHGWSLDGVSLFELSTAEQTMQLEDDTSLYATSEVELKETMRVLLAEVERLQPTRVVFDSLSEVRLLAQTAVRYRRQILALKQHFLGRRCTVLLLDDRAVATGDIQLESLAHGVIELEQLPMEYGADRRRLRVSKLRGSGFRSGHHDYVIQRGGIRVYPRLVAAEHRTDVRSDPIASGVEGLDRLVGGGLDRSTATLLMGPAGAGKSAIATQFACAAAARGEHAAMFLFEERVGTLRTRAHHLGIPLEKHVAAGRISLKQADPAELAPDEFTSLVRDSVEKDGARVVVIDSLNGFYNALPQAHHLPLLMHELLAYLSERGVASLLTVAQSGLAGPMTSKIDVSYLSDTIVLLRYFEHAGRLRKAISVVKKRSGRHEDTIRELILAPEGIRVGETLTRYRGVLTGVPDMVRETASDDGPNGGA